MANNKAIQILRTKEDSSNNITGITDNNKEVILLDGQPFYNKQKNYLTVGDGTKKANGLPITVPTVEGWFADAGASGLNVITGTKSEFYKISPIVQDSTNKLDIENKYNDDYISKISLDASSTAGEIYLYGSTLMQTLAESKINLMSPGEFRAASKEIYLKAIADDVSSDTEVPKASISLNQDGGAVSISGTTTTIQGTTTTDIIGESITLKTDSSNPNATIFLAQTNGLAGISGTTTTIQGTTTTISGTTTTISGTTTTNIVGTTTILKTSSSNEIAYLKLVDDTSNNSNDGIEIKAPKISLKDENGKEVLKTSTDSVTIAGSLSVSKGGEFANRINLNLTQATANADRPIWMGAAFKQANSNNYEVYSSQPTYSLTSDFKYNPGTSLLTVKNANVTEVLTIGSNSNVVKLQYDSTLGALKFIFG